MLSLNERDRRYKVIRAAMKEQGIDALLIKGSGGHYVAEGQANFRYVTNLGNATHGQSYGAYAILPADEPPVVFLNYRYGPGTVDVPWIDAVYSRGFSGEGRRGSNPQVVSEELRRLKADGAKVGVVGLKPRSGSQVGDGPISYEFYSELVELLPNANLVDATDILLEARSFKSEEELAMMTRAEVLNFDAYKHVQKIAGPGVSVREVWTDTMRHLINNGADVESWFGVDCSAEPHDKITWPRSLQQHMQPGDFLNMNTGVFHEGYGAHDHLFMTIGTPKPQVKKLVDVCREAGEACLAVLRPGMPSTELLAPAYEVIASRGLKRDLGDLHCTGLEIQEFAPPSTYLEGFDHLPRQARPYRITPGMVLAFQIHVADDDHRIIEGGGMVVVTAKGYDKIGETPWVPLEVAEGLAIAA